MDTTEFAEFLLAEADRVVVAAAGTRVASETYRLMLEMRQFLFRSERVTCWSQCAIPASAAKRPATGLVAITDRTIYLCHFAEDGASIERLAVPLSMALGVKWRAVGLDDGSQVAVCPGVFEFAVPRSAVGKFEAAFIEGAGV